MSRATDLIHHVCRMAQLPGDRLPLDRELLSAFVTHCDGAAFAGLVRRHGPMVLSVCRRVLQDHHDAEDAFQATFLVLARKAASVKPRHRVGNWLYGVAYRTALAARTLRRKRRERQGPLTDVPEAAASQPAAGADAQLVLHEELNRLPAHYRTIIVLCDLEGKTQKEAARELACPPGTVASRLTRGRRLLAKRLAKRGLALAGGPLALALAGDTVLAGVPAPLAISTVKAATTVAAGGVATSVVSAKVAALAKGALANMFLTKLKMAAVMVLVMACVGIAGGLAFRTQAAAELPFVGAKADPKKGAPADGGAPDDRPVAELGPGRWAGVRAGNQLELPVRKQGEANAETEGGKAVEKATGLKEGVWVFQGLHNIVGAGRDTVVTLEKKQGKWLISFRHVQHFSVNANKPPQETGTGPYVVTVAGPVLEYQGPDGVEQFSYRFDGDSLVMPAVVRLDERTWMMHTTSTLYDPAKKAKATRSEKYLWRCQSDPTKIDKGEAEFPPFGKQAGAPKGQHTYVFSQEKNKAGRLVSILRFLSASKGKNDATESCRLTWDAEGAIQVEARSLPPDWHQRKYAPKAPKEK